MAKVMIALLVMSGALLVGCKDDAKGGGDGKTGSATESIGVPECDDYFKKFEECINKNPAMKASMGDTVKQNREAWKQVAAGPGKDTLKTTCKAAADAIAQACK
jgi:hypothetical protein